MAAEEKEICELRILVFAKAPISGTVKTRMQPLLSEAECLQLHCELLQQTLSNAEAVGDVALWVSEPHAYFSSSYCAAFPRREQRGRDLGERMLHALEAEQQSAETLILLGADCPLVSPQRLLALHAAVQQKDGADLAMQPALDGGYSALALRGLQRPPQSIFCGIDWGSARVLQQTLQAADQAKLRCDLLDPVSDIDRPADLAQLSPLPALQHWSSPIL